MGVVISSTTTRPPGLTTRIISAQPSLQIGEVARAEADRRRVEAVVLVRAARARWRTRSAAERSRQQRPPSPAPARASAPRSPCRSPRPPGPTRAASASARSPVPVATSSAVPPRVQRRELGRALAPAVVKPRGHHRVHPVIEAGDPVEHRPHLRLLEHARRSGRRRAAGRPGRSDLCAAIGPGVGLLQFRQETYEILELLRVLGGESLERRHRRRRVDQRRGDRLRREQRADVRQVRAGPVVAV